MPKEKIFSKLKDKDYNNLLEQILEKKDFSSTGKNLILSILYKMETNYNDYKMVKRDVSDKEEVLNNFINIVKENCKNLVIIKPESNRSDILNDINSKYIANIEKKELEVFQNEKCVMEGLYSLYNNEHILNEKYGILKDAITEILTKGNSSNNIELLRDFNGFAWYISSNEFEDIYSNLIFQNIRIIAGNELLEEWIHNKDEKEDYLDKLKQELKRRYENDFAEKLFKQIIVTILKIYIERNPKRSNELENIEEKTSKKNIDKITKEKKELLKRVEYLDRCINDSEELKKELLKSNTNKNELQLRTDLIEEREKCIKQIMEYNKKLDPRQIIKQIKGNKANRVSIFNYKEILESDETALDELIKLQKMFLKGYKILAEKLSGKKEVLELLYEFRYYNLIPISKQELLKDNEELKEDIILRGDVVDSLKKVYDIERLAGKSVNDFERLNKLSIFANQYRVHIVLKGAHSVIATPDRRLFFNMSGNPGMAKGGAGDVLTGVLLALAANKLNLLDLLRIGVFAHGLAGDCVAEKEGRRGCCAGMIAERMGEAWKRLEK